MRVGDGPPLGGGHDIFLRKLAARSPSERVDALVELWSDQQGSDTGYGLLPIAIQSRDELVTFIDRLRKKRGLGSGMKRAIAEMLTTMPPAWFLRGDPFFSLDGCRWTWRDILRIVRPKPATLAEELRFAYMSGSIPVDGMSHAERLMEVLDGHKSAHAAVHTERTALGDLLRTPGGRSGAVQPGGHRQVNSADGGDSSHHLIDATGGAKGAAGSERPSIRPREEGERPDS